MEIYDNREKDNSISKLIAEGEIIAMIPDNRPQTWVHLDSGYSILITDDELTQINTGITGR